AGLARLPEFERAIVVANVKGLSMAARRVLSALIDIAEARGRTTINVSWRQIRELSGTGDGSIGRALEELKRSGIVGLGRHASDNRLVGQATEFRLNTGLLDRSEVRQNRAQSVTPTPVVAPDCRTWPLHHPAFWPGGLTPVGWQIWTNLSAEEPRSKADLARSGDVDRRSLDRHLPLLVDVGAVVRVGTPTRPKYLAVSDFDFDRYASDHGLFERQRQLELEHIEDRREFIGYQMSMGAISAREALERFSKLRPRPESRPVSRSAIVINDRRIDPLTGEFLESEEAVPPPADSCPAGARDGRYCRCCGRPSTRIHPTVGLPWHDWCLMPAWVARIERRNGVEIPDELVAPLPSPPVDPWQIDPPLPMPLVSSADVSMAVAA
ncbi:MAG: hypothetical protein AB7Q27_27960, partial [Acidimicrobiia bacterium]